MIDWKQWKEVKINNFISKHTLSELVAGYHEEDVEFLVDRLQSTESELSTLRAELDKLKQKEPVGMALEEVADFGTHEVFFTSRVEKGQPLYAHPVPLRQAPNNLCAKLKIVSRRLDKEGLLVLRDTVNQAIDFLSPTPPSDETK